MTEEIRQIKKKGVALCPSCQRPPTTTYVGMSVMVDCWLCKLGTSGHETLDAAEADWNSTVEEWILHNQFENGCYDPEAFEQQIAYQDRSRARMLAVVMFYILVFFAGYTTAWFFHTLWGGKP